MDFDRDKVDEMTLALMFLTSFGDHGCTRSWKGYDWDAMDRLHQAGYISNPVGKAKSVIFTDKGRELCEALFKKHFCENVGFQL